MTTAASGPYVAGEQAFGVRSPAGWLGCVAAAVLRHLRVASGSRPPSVWYTLSPHASPQLALDTLVWRVNQQAAGCRRGVPLHAGAVAGPSGVVVLPGPSGAGKSTLVAGLVRRGFGYLSDEVAIVEPASLEVRPYPKWLTLSSRTVETAVLAVDGRWHVDPEALRPGAVSAPGRLAAIVLPRYDPDAPTRVEPLRRGEGLFAVAEHTFGLASRATALADLASVVRGVPVIRLVSGSLDEACAAVEALAA